MKGLRKVVLALGMSPESTAWIVENQIGRDDYCWIHFLPREMNEGLVAYVNFGKDAPPEQASSVSGLKQFSESIFPDLRTALPECLQEISVDNMTVLLQKTIPGSRSLAAALRVLEEVGFRLDTTLCQVLDWLFEVAKHQPPAILSSERIESIREMVCGGGGIDEDSFAVHANRLAQRPGLPCIPCFGSLRPEDIHIGEGRFCFRVRDQFLPCDPLWSDLFSLRAMVVGFFAAEGEREARAAVDWLDGSIAAGFESLGIDETLAGSVRVMADMERFAHFYTLRHPDPKERRKLRLRISQAIQGSK